MEWPDASDVEEDAEVVREDKPVARSMRVTLGDSRTTPANVASVRDTREAKMGVRRDGDLTITGSVSKSLKYKTPRNRRAGGGVQK